MYSVRVYIHYYYDNSVYAKTATHYHYREGKNLPFLIFKPNGFIVYNFMLWNKLAKLIALNI